MLQQKNSETTSLVVTIGSCPKPGGRFTLAQEVRW